ncbi:Serine/threonine-protein phosphatase 2A activator [Gryllus bimaculatus]|nr:Serine/threonine-protein phosphatase 2A activator [Gryllus bimaculatus]
MAAEIDLENHPFIVPKRAVLTIEDMHVWEKSEAYADYLGFIMTLNDAVKGISTATKCSESEVTKGMVLLLDKLDQWIDETPPVEQPQRFGNQAFRQWYSKLKQVKKVAHNEISHPRIEPKSFLDNSVVQQYAGQYMFIACIEFINKVKTGVFAEHSNQLWNISGVATWTKINSGLIKMYKAEVLGKFPVIQHVLFGSLMTFTATKRPLGGLRSFRMDVTERPPETPATPPD